MNKKEYTIEDAHNYITLRNDGTIKCKSVFRRNFTGDSWDFYSLMSCVEDNIIDDVTIDWPAVERDYRAFKSLTKKTNILKENLNEKN